VDSSSLTLLLRLDYITLPIVTSYDNLCNRSALILHYFSEKVNTFSQFLLTFPKNCIRIFGCQYFNLLEIDPRPVVYFSRFKI